MLEDCGKRTRWGTPALVRSMMFEPVVGRDRSLVPLVPRARQLRSTDPVLGRTVGVLVVVLPAGLDETEELRVF